MSNPVREKMRRGEPVFGPSFGFACPELVEIAGLLGYDFSYLDAEHGSISPRECADLVRAADARQFPTIVRVGTHDPQVMLRYLECGVVGIQLPHTRSRQDAEEAVRAVRFHPHGERGLAGSRWSDWGLREPLARVIERVNEEMLLIGQIEDRVALDHLEEIVAVPGIDVWVVGPADLSAAVGYPGQRAHPLVVETVAMTIRRLRDLGQIVGTAAPAPEEANYYMDLGVQYFTVNVPRIFISGAQAFQRGLRVPDSMRGRVAPS
jgi:4-hydroxy-2-oxoheptanedioate aldolase